MPLSKLSLLCNRRSVNAFRTLSTISPPKLFDYATIKKTLKPNLAMVNAIESAFGMLAKDLVDVPLPMHIGELLIVSFQVIIVAISI